MNVTHAFRAVIAFEKKLLDAYLEHLQAAPFHVTYPEFLHRKITGSLNIMHQLMMHSPSGQMEEWEYPMVFASIEDLQKKGWTEAEIIGHLRWLEHVDPRIEEDVALRHLKRTREAVELRLKT